ncbi:hypothetical protein Tsubulata_016683 [Turnera subulata]|uniref:Protein transport protein SEC23 n=1 Tax=Turnera subulata TaxID=218843 RepID=A0A9Q0JNU7_9ROSI|nr:hypothetical protein Tsubulata_016683 [Turnera subulata]
MPILPYSPLRCRNCRSVLNPFSVIDFEAKIWICPICFHRNHFPPHHAASISPDTLPPELFPQYTTVENQQDDASSPPPLTCLFVVNTCLLEEEIGFLRSALSQAMHLIRTPPSLASSLSGASSRFTSWASPTFPRPTSSTAPRNTPETPSSITWASSSRSLAPFFFWCHRRCPRRPLPGRHLPGTTFFFCIKK